MRSSIYVTLILLSLAALGSAGVPLQWDASPTAGVSYRLYEDGAIPVKVADVAAGTTSYNIPNVSAGSHVYFVVAVLNGIESAASNKLTAIVPAAPGNLRLNVTGTLNLNISSP